MLPPPGQGALACECRADDGATIRLLERLDDSDTRAAVTAERSLLATLEAGCSAPVGALAEIVEGDDGVEALASCRGRRRFRLAHYPTVRDRQAQ
ncbi:hypothetical protein [Aeromicrobium sp. UC242_57]|uniref:hypothetical protein n=1 Tax=Aeromicrobium sp. UC242_57 TaxID=3374624 RepID=UPI00378BF75D